MKKIHISLAVCALAFSLVVAPGAIGKPGQGKGPKGAKQVVSSISLFATPSTITPTTTGVTASGNVSANSSCRKDRTVRFSYTNTTTGAVTPLAVTVVTGPNGDYTAVLPKPTDAAPATVTLKASVDQAERKVGSKKKGKKKKKGRQFLCLAGESAPSTLTVTP